MNYDDWKLMTPSESNEDEKEIFCESCNEEICMMNQSKITEICINCYKLLY